MKQTTLAVLAAGSIAACAPAPEPGPPFPEGARSHGPYLDRSFEGFVVRATYVTDLTVISVQSAPDAVEPGEEALSAARTMLRDGTGEMPESDAGLIDAAPEFEAAALKAAQIPGWCPFETRFAFIDPLPAPTEFAFRIRGTYSAKVGGFVFAGQCRPA